MSKLTLNIEGTPAELAAVLASLDGAPHQAAAPKVEAKPAPKVAKPAPKVEAKPAPKAKPAVKAKKPTVKATAPEPEDEEVEDEEVEDEEVEDEDEEEAEDEDEDEEEAEDEEETELSASGIDPSHPALQEARRLREVVQHLIDNGCKERDAIIQACSELQASVPILQRVQNIEVRVGKAFDMLDV